MTPVSRAGRIADAATLACLATLPWIGLCVVKAVSGRDLGAGFQPAYLLLMLALAAAILDARGRADAPAVPVAWFWSLALGTILVSALGVWRAPGLAPPDEAWARYARQLVQWLLMAAFAWHLARWLRGERRWRWAVTALAAGLVFQTLYGAWQAVDFYRPGGVFAALERVFTSNPAILSGSEELYLGRDFVGVPRVRGTACEPLYLGNYVLMVLPWLWLSAAGRRRRLWLPLLAVLLLAATWSRGAWLAAGPGLLAAVVLAARAGRLRWRRLTAFAVPAVLLGLVAAHLLSDGRLTDLIWQRLRQSVSTEDWSNLTRWYSMQAAWRGYELSPLYGIGWGQFGHHFARLVDPMGLQSQFAWPVVNNYPLAVLCETGVLGFAALVVSVAALARRVWRAVTPSGDGALDAKRRRLIAAAAGATAVWAQLMTFSQYNLPHIWVAVGLLLAALSEAETGEARR